MKKIGSFDIPETLEGMEIDNARRARTFEIEILSKAKEKGLDRAALSTRLGMTEEEFVKKVYGYIDWYTEEVIALSLITLYYLVIDDQIVEDPDAWTYTGRTHTWRAWEELSSLIEKVEAAYGVKVYFCRRFDATVILARMLVSDYHPPETDLTPVEMLEHEIEYMRVPTRLKLQELEKELSSFQRTLDALITHLDIDMDSLLSTITTKELSSLIT